jgi:hypothetical protein
MSVLTRNLAGDGSLVPSVLNVLEQIPDHALFYTAHRLRHPSVIYALSLEKIAEAFCQVGEEYLLESENHDRDHNASLEMTQLFARDHSSTV